MPPKDDPGPPADSSPEDVSESLPEVLPSPPSTNEVEILREIVEWAALNRNAVWKAYDHVLDARGIDPEKEENIYNVLTHFGDAEGSTLHEKLAFTLRRTGVREVQGEVQRERALDEAEEEEVSSEDIVEYRRRRAEEAKERRNQERQSFASEEEYHAEDEKVGRGTRPARKVGGTVLEVRPGRVRRADGGSPRDDAAKAAQTTTRQRRIGSGRHPSSLSDEDDAISSTERRRKQEEMADQLYALQMRKLLLTYFRHWQDCFSNVSHMWRQAVKYDHHSLLRQSFDRWLDKRFFSILERRAERRYNGRLVLKVWKGWVQQTAAIVQRTNEVRLRILARKYFLAWQGIVVENNRKVHLFRLGLAFYRWQNKTRKRQAQEDLAVARYHENLAGRALRVWKWKLSQALAWRKYTTKLQKRMLLTWYNRTDAVWEMEDKADAFYRLRSLRKVFRLWMSRTDEIIQKEDQAVMDYDYKVALQIFQNWRRSVLLKPLVLLMEEFVNDRVVFEHFTLWRKRTQLERVSAELYKRNLTKRVLREWRLQSRADVILDKQEDRVKTVFYKHWVLQTRLQLQQRVIMRRLLSRVLNLVKTNCVKKYQARLTSFRAIGSKYNSRLASDTFSQWHDLTEARLLQLDFAVEDYNRKLAYIAIDNWRTQLATLRTNETLAAAREYSLSTKHTLQLWKPRYHEAKKARLKAAYQTFARKRRRRIAGGVLETWISKMDYLRSLDESARDFDESRLRDYCSGLLDHWRARTEAAVEHFYIAEEHNNIRLAKAALGAWFARKTVLEEANEEAERRFNERQYVTMSKYLRRWHIRHWDWTQLLEKGERLAERNAALHARGKLREWRDKALNRRTNITQIPFEPEKSLLPSTMPPPPRPPSSIFRTSASSFLSKSVSFSRQSQSGSASTPAATPTPIQLFPSTPGRRNKRLMTTAKTPAGTPGSPLRRMVVEVRGGAPPETMGRGLFSARRVTPVREEDADW